MMTSGSLLAKIAAASAMAAVESFGLDSITRLFAESSGNWPRTACSWAEPVTTMVRLAEARGTMRSQVSWSKV